MHERAARALPCNPFALRDRVAIPTNSVNDHHRYRSSQALGQGGASNPMYAAGEWRPRRAAASAMRCGLADWLGNVGEHRVRSWPRSHLIVENSTPALALRPMNCAGLVCWVRELDCYGARG